MVGVGDTVMALQLVAAAQTGGMVPQPQWDCPVNHKFSLLLVQASDSDAAVLCNTSYSGECLCCLPSRNAAFKRCFLSQACFLQDLRDFSSRYRHKPAAT